MRQPDPPAVAVLAGLPTKKTVGLTLHRVFRTERPSPWFFAGIPAGGNPDDYGRFDLPYPDGACYTATSAVGSVLETFQHLEDALLPDAELRRRTRVTVLAPGSSPPAANLTAARTRGIGVTLELASTADRGLTQRWADQLRRAGHRALLHALRHDPTGRLRAVTLFDKAGPHPPYGDDQGWAATRHGLDDDPALRAALRRYGITVERSDPALPIVTVQDSGLL